MDKFNFEAKDNYPPGVVRYAKNFGELYDAQSKLRTLCLTFFITRDLLLYTLAEASLKKLLLTHDVVLSEFEITQALVDAAEAAYIEKRMERIDGFHVDHTGHLVYECSDAMHKDIRSIAAFIHDWAEKHV